MNLVESEGSMVNVKITRVIFLHVWITFIGFFVNVRIQIFVTAGLFGFSFYGIPQAERNSLEARQNPLLLPY